jgi:hypothetical protein
LEASPLFHTDNQNPQPDKTKEFLMCVAVFKPAGADTPTLEILRKCWDANPDGAGVAISEKNHVYLKKGFMEFKALEKFYKRNRLKDGIDRAMVFHFRIGTHGPKDAGNTHPFPVTDNPDILRGTEGRFKQIAAHNGIMSNTIENPESKISDTGQFLVNCFRAGGDPVKYWQANPKEVGGGKLVVLKPGNRFTLLGSWQAETEVGGGCFYSNLTWKWRCSSFTGFKSSATSPVSVHDWPARGRVTGRDHFGRAYGPGNLTKSIAAPAAKPAAKSFEDDDFGYGYGYGYGSGDDDGFGGQWWEAKTARDERKAREEERAREREMRERALEREMREATAKHTQDYWAKKWAAEGVGAPFVSAEKSSFISVSGTPSGTPNGTPKESSLIKEALDQLYPDPYDSPIAEASTKPVALIAPPVAEPDQPNPPVALLKAIPVVAKTEDSKAAATKGSRLMKLSSFLGLEDAYGARFRRRAARRTADARTSLAD